MTYYTYAETPAGDLLFIGDGKVVTGAYWRVYKRIPTIQPDWIEDTATFAVPIQQLQEYFAGKRKVFDFAYKASGTPFQMAVWKELEKLPFGARSSYKAIANAIGKPAAVRAVGTAVGSNPIAIAIPCHRVLTSQGTTTGYAGGPASKQSLLDRETH